MKNKKLRSQLTPETRNNRQKQQISARQITSNQTLIPQSKRSNTFLISPKTKTMLASIKIEDNQFKLETEPVYRSNTISNSKSKLPEISSPINMDEPPESCKGRKKFIFPPTCIKKIKEINNGNQNDGIGTVSHNDFRRSLNFNKKPMDKQDKPIIISKRKNSENISVQGKEVQQKFDSKTDITNSKFILNRNNKCQIIAKSNSSFDSDKENEDLKINIPVLTVNNSCALSHAGKNKAGLTKVNQDSYLLSENILGLSDYCIYGIMDGHGANGHLVSQFIESEAKVYFSNEVLFLNENSNNSSNINEQLIQEKLVTKEYNIINSFYKKVNSDLLNKKFDVHFSGSTCVIVFHIGNKLICANTGDSRAILIRDTCSSIKGQSANDSSKYYAVIPLSIDHKPESKEERKRIESLGGEVDQYETQGIKDGPFRVWVKGEVYPGIAISRTIGDEIAESIGVIYNPEVISKELTVSDKYIVIASDGVWEFMDNDTVMNIVNPFFNKNDPEGGCKALINESIKRWEKEDEVIDDISLIIIFLKNDHFK